MKRLVIAVVTLVSIFAASAWSRHDVDESTTLGDATHSQLFRVIFNVPQSVVDSARVWYSGHANQDTLVSEHVLFRELTSRMKATLRSWERQHIARNTPPPETTF